MAADGEYTAIGAFVGSFTGTVGVWPPRLIFAQLIVAAWFLWNPAGAPVAGLPLDDAWIHLVYGRALLEHGLPYYNPGQMEAGWTSPAQAVISAAVVAISHVGIPVAVVAKLASLFLTLPATVLAGRIAARRAGAVAGTMAAALVALSPTVAFAQLSGMEVGLCSTLILLTLDRCDRGLSPGWVLACAILARPECILLIPAVALASRPRSLLPALVATSLWAAANLEITGRPLPPTFYAKAEPISLSNLILAGRALTSACPGLLLGTPLWIWVVAAALRARRWGESAFSVFPLVFIVAVAAGRHVSADASYFYFLRYFLPVEPLFAVGVAVGVAGLADRLRLAGITLGAVLLIAGFPELASRRDLYAAQCQNIEEMQGVIADYLMQNATPGDKVATIDAGVVRYRSGLPTYDLVGLNNHELLRDSTLRKRLLTDSGALASWMDENGIQWLVTFPGVIPHAQPAADPGHFFGIVLDRTSEDYRVAPPAQGRMVLAHRLVVAPSAPL